MYLPLDPEHPEDGDLYWVPLDGLDDQRIVEWVEHVRVKTWVDSDVLTGLMVALRETRFANPSCAS